jgi:AcrR family transcriptional regulator
MPRISPAREAATRQRILAAAWRVFEARGYHEATMRDVVRESGLSVGAIYGYYPSKEALFRASAVAILNAEIDALLVDLTSRGTVREKLEVALRAWFERALGSPQQARFLARAWAQSGGDPVVREMLVRRRERIVTVGSMLLREGIASGELSPDLDVESLASGVTALLDGLLLMRVEGGEAFTREAAERRVRAVIDLLYRALAGGGGAAPVAPPW